MGWPACPSRQRRRARREASRKAKADEAANKETDEQTVVLAEDAEKAEKVNRGTENHEESFDHS